MRQILQDYLDSHTPEQLRAGLDKRKHLQMVDVKGQIVPITKLHWWRKDKDGWPIETVKGHPFSAFIRIVCQNLRKLVG